MSVVWDGVISVFGLGGAIAKRGRRTGAHRATYTPSSRRSQPGKQRVRRGFRAPEVLTTTTAEPSSARTGDPDIPEAIRSVVSLIPTA